MDENIILVLKATEPKGKRGGSNRLDYYTRGLNLRGGLEVNWITNHGRNRTVVVKATEPKGGARRGGSK